MQVIVYDFLNLAYLLNDGYKFCVKKIIKFLKISYLTNKTRESVYAGAAISAGIHCACVCGQLILQQLQPRNQLIHLQD